MGGANTHCPDAPEWDDRSAVYRFLEGGAVMLQSVLSERHAYRGELD
jgi:hypothetical protein